MGPSSCLESEDTHPEGGALRKRTSRVGGCRGTGSVLSGMQGQEGQTADSKRQHVCDVCSATFVKPAHLQQHLVIHTGQRPFLCPQDGCTCSFKRQDHLRRHMLSHSKPVLHCPIQGCPVTCTLQDNLRAHVKRHQAAQFRCSEPQCTYETAFKRQLWEHVRSCHQARHSCQEVGCGKVFKFRSLLAAHESSVHRSKTKREAPLVSSMDQSQDAHLASDCKDAQGRSPSREAGCSSPAVVAVEDATPAASNFACPVPGCTAEFRLRRYLKQHMTVVHLKEARYRCATAGCSSSFLSERNRAHHMATKHPSHDPDSPKTDSALGRESNTVSILNQPVFVDSP